VIKIRAGLLVNSRCAHCTWKALVGTLGWWPLIYTGAASQTNTTCVVGTTLVCLYFHVRDALKSSLCHHNLSLIMMIFRYILVSLKRLLFYYDIFVSHSVCQNIAFIGLFIDSLFLFVIRDP
jgi:hypothetical protein